MNPKLSIIIPTKDRYSTLIPIVKSIVTNISGKDIELIIQDNSRDNNEIIKFLSEVHCENIRYFHCLDKLTMTDNCNLAIENSQGDFLTMIGDDDFVSPFILDIVLLMINNRIDCLFYTPGNYYWPGVKFIKESFLKKESSLQISKFISSKIEIIDTEDVLVKLINSGAYGLGNLPRFYHGITNRTLIEKVKELFGTYVPGPSPDMAISTALACVIKKHHFINYPVTITGVSKNSAAGLGAKGAHISRIEDVPFLPTNIIENWDPSIPKIWTGPTIYVQTVYEVLSKINYKYQSINYQRMYEYMYVFLPSTRKILKPYLKRILAKSFLNKLEFLKSIIYWTLRKYLFLYFDFLKAKVLGIRQYTNIETISQCNKILLSIGSPYKY